MKMSDIPYSMPSISPSYPEPPYLYRGGSILMCVYRAGAEAMNSVVPEPLKPAEGNLVHAWINDFNIVGFTHYHEAIISVPVEFQGKMGSYMTYLFLDNDSTIVAGREIWGFPKKEGHFTSLREANFITRSVDKGGVEILRISMEMTRPGTLAALSGLGNPIYNLKVIPSVRKGAPPDVKQLTATTLQNVVVHRVIEGKATVGLSPTGPLSLLAPLEVVGGFYCELDFDLTYGEVAYDYLAGVPQPELATASF